MNSNDPCLSLRRTVEFLNTPKLPDRGPGEDLLILALELIDEARVAMDRSLSESQRYARQRAWLIKTDPTVYPVVLGGTGVPDPL